MAVRTVRTGLVGIAAAAALTATAFSAPAQADADGGHRPTQEAMDAAVEGGAPGVAGQAEDAHGTWKGTSGVGNLDTGTPRSAHDRYRVGSVTKTFVSTVLLQLQAEGRIDLDDTVEQWLPGVVEGNGHDGSKITVRQLLNHTSGVFNYTADPEIGRKSFTTDFLKHRFDTYTGAQIVDVAMGHEPTFQPGKGWSYSNTNYVLAGLIIEKVTGHSYGDEIEDRIIEPLDLDATRLPGTDPTVSQPSSRAYSKLAPPDDPDAKIHDVTEMNPSIAGAAGSMISDSGDLNRFYSALLRGKLLPAAELKEMKTMVPTGDAAPNMAYGLGLMKMGLSCGKDVWGHSGGINGSSTYAVSTEDGRHALSFNFNGDWADGVEPIVEAEFCGKQP